jgi:hypothetical protein
LLDFGLSAATDMGTVEDGVVSPSPDVSWGRVVGLVKN